MSLQALTDAAAAQNALTDRINAFLDNIDADIATREAAYDALASDLVGVVAERMNFTATWNPDEANPDNVVGGTFADLATLIAAAPNGADVTVQIAAAQTVHIDQNINILNQRLIFVQEGAGNKPRIVFDAYDNGASANYYRISSSNYGGSAFVFQSVIIELADRPDQAIPFANAASPLSHLGNGSLFGQISLQACEVTSNEAVSLLRLGFATSIFLSSQGTVIDGPIEVVERTNGSVLIVSTHGVTLQNGAVLYSGGTVGQDILES